jgi:putative oxidoreductase
MSIRHIDINPQALGRLGFFQHGAGRSLLRGYEHVDSAVIGFLRAHADDILRIALATVFVWFGALKIIGRSPVGELVADTVGFLPESAVVPVLGIVEVAIGLGLILGVGLRLVLLLFLMQMAGTFLVLLTQPGDSFQNGNPLLLTTLGEFVVKNIVFIAAGLVIGSHIATALERAREQRNA